MANGPLGGFMPTPAAPAQPPQVKLDTTAVSRGNFNNFLKNMNGATSVNPPVVAPAMGAMTPNMAPALSNIDIFDQPVSMMQQGGNVPPRNTNIMGQPHMLAYITPQEGQLLENLGGANQPGPMGIPSFFDVGEGMGGFGSEDSAVSGGEASSDNDESIVGDDPIAGDNFEVISTPTVTDQEQQQNIAESRQFVNTPSIPNVVFNNQAIFNATKDLPEGNQTQIQFKKDIVNTLKDYAKDNDLAGALNQFQIEAADGDKRGETIVNNIIKASNVNPATYSAAVFNQADEKRVTDALNLETPTDFREIVADPRIGSPALAGLPGVKSRFNTQTQTIPDVPVLAPRTQFARNVEDQRAAERGRALGETTVDDSLDILDTFMFNQRVQDLLDRGTEAQRIKDIENRENRVQELLDRGARAQETKDLLDRLDQDTIAENLDKDAPTRTVNRTSGTTTELDSEFGDVFPTVDPFGIEAPKVQALLNKTNLMPQATGFKVGKTTIPSLASGINTLLSGATDMMNKRIYDGITKKGQTPVYDPITGAITGSRDPNTGILMEGTDFADQNRATSDNEPNQPLIRTLTPKQDEEKPDLPPNVIGGMGGQIGNLQPITADTVVASPFTPASSNIQPINFDAGQLNRLIELLTGVPARPVVSAKKGGVIGMANGGLIKAVDDFLAAG